MIERLTNESVYLETLEKQFTEVFTNQVQKEIREVDKNLDNE